MKVAFSFTSSLLALSTAHAVSRSDMKKLLSNARRLDQGGNNGNQNGGNDEVYDFLDNYSIVLSECHSDISLLGNDEYPIYGAIVFRMCPSNSCDASGKVACKSGYADFAVDIGTYVAAMMNDQEDNMQWDDQYGDLADYAECAAYEQENGGSYYVGPTCTDDGKGIRLALFDEYSCQTESATSFSSLSNGQALPYSDGGMVSDACISCYDNDAGGPKELCMDLYDAAAYRCEEDWDVQHYYWNAITEVNKYGTDTTGCVTIRRFNYTKPKANIIGELFFVVVLVGIAIGGYFFYQNWWEKQKENLERIDTDDEGDDDDDDEYHMHESDDEGEEGEGPTGGTMA